ncbi:type IA DNA topoisomerase [Bifidobacterium longum]|nr:type IA DNA topoisomerase [Bifidobacterium longum]
MPRGRPFCGRESEASFQSGERKINGIVSLYARRLVHGPVDVAGRAQRDAPGGARAVVRGRLGRVRDHRQTHGQPDDRGIRRTDLEPHAGDGHRVDRRRHPHADRGAGHRRRVRAAARLRRLTLATPLHPGPAGKGFPRRSSHVGQESRNPKKRKERERRMKLVIAEKKSVATAIAQALCAAPVQRDGCYECGQLLVTWAQGHLIDLAMPEDYKDRDWRKWSLDTLPVDPSGHWQWKISEERGAGSRYRQIVQLIRRADVDCLVNACDPDREGEAIFRRIADMEGSHKPELRLWVASLEAEAIQAAWRAMKPESEYQGLAWSAEIRSKADWLTGMNASRAYSLLYNARFSVGRVQTPTLAMIAERDRQIRNHKPVPFWTVIADMGGWRLSSERIDSKDAAMLLRGQAEHGRFRIMSVNRRRVNDRPPRLYDLTGLQKDMSRMYGMTAARTLAALQHLYELKLATYPRTDSRYITHDDLETLTALLESGRLAHGFVTREGIPGHPRPELTVNDAKVAGHTAILPTMQLDAGKLEGLDDDERKVMTRIVRRMWEAVGDDHVHIVTEVKARLSDDTDREFSSRSDETVSAGWKAVETGHGPEPEDEETANPAGGRNVIPSNLTEGGVIRPVGKVTVEEGETRPPKPFTEATLLAAMEHASRCVEDKSLKAALDDDESHSGGIGTPATRADTIEKLVRSKLVERKGRQLHATTEGERLTDVVEPRLKDVLLTARMEQALSDVEHGKRGPSEVMDMFHREALRIPADATANLKADAVTRTANTDAQEWGDCPRCGQPVRKTGRMWQCSTNKTEKTKDGKWATTAGCGWKMFARIAGKTITDQTARRLLAGQSVTLKGFTSKSGKKFDAAIRIDKERGTAFDFDR